MWHRFLFWLVVLAVSLVGARARAEPALVVLVRPPQQNAIVNEAITRIRGELVADGFNVLIIDASPAAEPASVLALAAAEKGAAATLGLFLHPDAKLAEVWIVDRMTNKTVMRKIELPPTLASSAPEVLARRSVELLRASLLEILVRTREEPAKSAEPRARASEWAARGLEPSPSRWSIEAGAQALGGLGGIAAALMPVGRVRFGLNPQSSVRLTLAGLGTQPRIHSPHGSASVSQALGLFELAFEVVPQGWLRPSVSLGAGAYHVGIDGSASLPYAGLDDERYVFAADAGAGLALWISTSWALSLEGHTTLVTPYPVIRFLEVNTAEIQNPLLSLVLTLAVRL